MARKQAPKNYAGGRKTKPGEKQAEARAGRDQNAAAKKIFKAGPHALVDRNAGRPNGPLLPQRQVAVDEDLAG